MGSGEEVEEEDDLENDDGGEIQSRMKSNGGTVVTVITRNVKEVSWPPPDMVGEKINYIKILPDLREKVHLGKNRRQKMDLDTRNFLGSTAHHFSSNPFSKGCLQPGKFIADEKWKPQEGMPGRSLKKEKPKMVLKDASSVLTQGCVPSSSEYKIPPGTTRHRSKQPSHCGCGH